MTCSKPCAGMIKKTSEVIRFNISHRDTFGKIKEDVFGNGEQNVYRCTTCDQLYLGPFIGDPEERASCSGLLYGTFKKGEQLYAPISAD